MLDGNKGYNNWYINNWNFHIVDSWLFENLMREVSLSHSHINASYTEFNFWATTCFCLFLVMFVLSITHGIIAFLTYLQQVCSSSCKILLLKPELNQTISSQSNGNNDLNQSNQIERYQTIEIWLFESQLNIIAISRFNWFDWLIWRYQT